MSPTSVGQITVVCAVVNTKEVVFYKEDGETFTIEQGDIRLPDLLIQVEGALTYPGAKVVLTIEAEPKAPVNTVYADYQKKSSGLVRFFKVAKTVLANILKLEDEKPTRVLGVLPADGSVFTQQPSVAQVTEPSPAASPFVERTDVTAEQAARAVLLSQIVARPIPVVPNTTAVTKPQLSSAVAEILAHAQTKPVEHEDFHERDVGDGANKTHTIVAVVDNKVVGGVERLKPQLAHSVALGSTKGMDAFMARIAVVASKRRHSVDELLNFLKIGDLPIADDGSIIIYKVLKMKPNGVVGEFVDCHTSRVTQKIGSFVHMDEKLVDPNRHQECSQGLHVATRRYIKGFSGDVICLGKVAPEDVIAVPYNESTKMRVCGYHLILELDQAMKALLRQNRAFTTDDASQTLLGRALAGDHGPILEDVKITAASGGGVNITPRQRSVKSPVIEQAVVVPVDVVTPSAVENELLPVAEPTPVRKAEVLAEPVEEEEIVKPRGPIVDPKALAQRQAVAKAESRTDKAQRLHKAMISAKSEKAKKVAATELLAFKKAVKLGWVALTLPADTESMIKTTLA